MRRSTHTMTGVAVLALAVTALPGLAQSGMDHSRHGAMTAGALDVHHLRASARAADDAHLSLEHDHQSRG